MKHLALPKLISLNRQSVAFSYALIATLAIVSLIPIAGARAQDGAALPAAGAPLRVLPTISVLGVIYLDDAGHGHAATSESGQGDAILAEDAISKSHAFHLVGRDLLAQQAAEIKMDAEGFVVTSSAQKFGKAVGIERFLQIVVADPSTREFAGQASESAVPANGDPMAGDINIDSGENHKSGGSTFNPFNPKNLLTPNGPLPRRNFKQATVKIICRFTVVETGDVEPHKYTGTATADAAHCDEHQLRSKALENAFDTFQADLVKGRTPLLGKVTEIDLKECQAAVDIGKEDGVTKGSIFEICESIRKVGGIIHLEPICDAVVTDVEPHVAVLDIGEYKQKDYFHKDIVFRPNKDKASQVQKGYVIREKK